MSAQANCEMCTDLHITSFIVACPNIYREFISYCSDCVCCVKWFVACAIIEIFCTHQITQNLYIWDRYMTQHNMIECITTLETIISYIRGVYAQKIMLMRSMFLDYSKIACEFTGKKERKTGTFDWKITWKWLIKFHHVCFLS